MINRQTTGPVMVLEINRPDAANSLDTAARTGLAEAFDEAEQDSTIRAIVITGAGDRAFCAGLDLRDMPTGYNLDEGLANRVVRSPLPTVAAVNGAAVGGGFELALACDMVVAASHAQFWLPEVERAMVPTDGGTRLAQRIPIAIAMELVLTSAKLDADRALTLGVVNRVSASDDVVAVATELALSACDGAPRALAWAKDLVRRAVTEPAADLRTAEADVTRKVFESDDVHEGTRAFLERRSPKWSGR